MVLENGDTAPNFKVVFHDGTTGYLLPDKGAFRYIVIYFFPRAFTSGCTRETVAFAKEYDWFKQKNIEIIGVSSDTLSRQKKFAEKHHVPFKLVADPELSVIKAYDVMGKSGKSAARVTYIIDGRTHRIVLTLANLRNAEQHVEKTKEFILKNV